MNMATVQSTGHFVKIIRAWKTRNTLSRLNKNMADFQHYNNKKGQK